MGIRVDVEVIDALGDLDEAGWNASLGARAFYASTPWLRIAAETADLPPFYLWSPPGSRRAAATLPCYPMAAGSPFPFCRVEFLARRHVPACASGEGARVARALMPSLFLGGRNPGHTRPGTAAAGADEQERVAILHALLLEAERAARRRGMSSVGMLHVDEDDIALRDTLTERGYLSFPHYDAAVLAVPDGPLDGLDGLDGFDGYLRSLNSNMRNNVRRERKRLERAGVRYESRPLDPAARAEADRLEIRLNQKYGTFDDAAVRRLRETIARHAFDHAGIELATIAGTAVGSLLYFRRDDELYVRTVGFDYEAAGGLPVYFGLLFYHLIPHAQRLGVRTVLYSTGSEEAKRRRGCRLVRQHAYVRALAPDLHRAFAELLPASAGAPAR